MRRLLAILAVIALVVAACGPSDAVDTSPDETTSPTPALTGTSRGCVGADPYPDDEACANFFEEEFSEQEEFTAEIVDVPMPGNAEHACLIVEDQFTAYPDVDFDNAEDFGLRPLNGADLEGSGWSGDETGEILGYLGEFPLGIYVRDDTILPADTDVFTFIDEVEANGGPSLSPHYALVLADPHWKYGPHSKAVSIDGNWTDLEQTGSDGERRVIIIDTGVVGDTGTIGINIGINTAEDEPPSLDPLFVAHGLFAASVVRQFSLGESTTIDVYRASDPGGALTELSVIASLLRADPQEGQVINLSLGTYPCRESDPTLGLIQALLLLDDVEITAASGNDNDNDGDGKGNNHQTMFPAILGFPGFAGTPTGVYLNDFGIDGGMLQDLASRVVAVGALNRDGDEASWSNPAEVHSPGADIVGWYYDSGDSGLAVWSGTSFAAPHFAACLASGACTPP